MSNSGEKLPLAWKEGKLSYTSGITLLVAKQMLEAAESEAKKLGLPMVIAITDAGGNVVALHRMDNAMLCSIQIAMDKAYTAVFGKLPTASWYNIFSSGGLPSLFFHHRWTAFPGGFPLVRESLLFGGIGSSGGTDYEDTSVARAALSAAGFSTDDADNMLSSIK